MAVLRGPARRAGTTRRLRYRWLGVVLAAAGVALGIVVAAPAQAVASQWTAVSAGASHTCGIKTDTTLWCWGANNVGQLGVGDTTNRSTPTAVTSAGSGWTIVDAGFRHACGTRTSGTGQCWGANDHGQLGLGDTTDRNTATIVTGGHWASMSAGRAHTCAQDFDGYRWCWGANVTKELGMVAISFYDQLTPYHDNGDGRYTVVDSGERTTCAVAGGSSRNLLCWGANVYGNVGNGNTVPSDSTISTLNWATTSSGGYHACAIRATGTIYCWGRNDAGQLGLGNNTDKLTETALPNAQQSPLWSKVSAGLRHTCGIRADNTLYCWGYNYSGQLGIGNTTNKNTPTLVP